MRHGAQRVKLGNGGINDLSAPAREALLDLEEPSAAWASGHPEHNRASAGDAVLTGARDRREIDDRVGRGRLSGANGESRDDGRCVTRCVRARGNEYYRQWKDRCRRIRRPTSAVHIYAHRCLLNRREMRVATFASIISSCPSAWTESDASGSEFVVNGHDVDEFDH
jgi:phage/plasmid primase-like uncharacterized protein